MVKKAKSKTLDKHPSILGFPDTRRPNRSCPRRTVASPSVARLLHELRLEQMGRSPTIAAA